jgi:hypothetical protein
MQIVVVNLIVSSTKIILALILTVLTGIRAFSSDPNAVDCMIQPTLLPCLLFLPLSKEM